MYRKYTSEVLRRYIPPCTASCVTTSTWAGTVTRCIHTHQNNEGQQHDVNRKMPLGLAHIACFAAVGWGIIEYSRGKNKAVLAKSAHHDDKKGTLKTDPFSEVKDLPTYSLDEVSKHATSKNRIWVTCGVGVYDITDFVPQHPGGSEKIMMAAGSSVDPFWTLYAVHKNASVLSLLEQFRIGNLSQKEADEVAANVDDPYASDPRRHAALKPSSVKPFNAEPPPSLLAESYITPTDLFYVRNHLPVPDVKEEDYLLEISGLSKDHTLSLHDLKTKFPKVTVTAAIMCAGNRRGEMTTVKPVKGLNWGHAAIGNATWSGARLVDVLKHLGLKEEDVEFQHVQFEGLDTDVSNVPYGASIPVEKALDPKGDVILAYEMNGKPLSRDHGYPLRAVAPGIVGARNVKWLGRIILSDKESDSHWQQNDYKGFNPSVDWDTVDFTKSPAIQELPVISAICTPDTGSTVKLNNDGTLNVKGYAWSGGGRRIVRVDITADGGKSWYSAEEMIQGQAKEPRHWGWTLWSINVPVPKDSKQIEIWAKAVDSSYNTQPECFHNIWNLRGVLSNAYHRVKVAVQL